MSFWVATGLRGVSKGAGVGGAGGPRRREAWEWAYRVWIWDVRATGAARFFEITEGWATRWELC